MSFEPTQPMKHHIGVVVAGFAWVSPSELQRVGFLFGVRCPLWVDRTLWYFAITAIFNFHSQRSSPSIYRCTTISVWVTSEKQKHCRRTALTTRLGVTGTLVHTVQRRRFRWPNGLFLSFLATADHKHWWC